jgi:hypothetical protein
MSLDRRDIVTTEQSLDRGQMRQRTARTLSSTTSDLGDAGTVAWRMFRRFVSGQQLDGQLLAERTLAWTADRSVEERPDTDR